MTEQNHFFILISLSTAWQILQYHLIEKYGMQNSEGYVVIKNQKFLGNANCEK